MNSPIHELPRKRLLATITRAPKRKLRTGKRRTRVLIEFASSDPAATFECSLDGAAFRSCSAPFRAKVKKGKHRFAVRATGEGGTDATPAEARWKVKRRRS